MESKENTYITDAEEGSAGQKHSRRSWIIAGCAVVAIVVIAVAVFKASLSPVETVHRPTAEDLEQLQYDARQQERDERRIEQLRDQSFIIRDDGATQSAQLLRGFNIAKPQLTERQIQQEEEAINHLLREAPAAKPAPVQQTASQNNNTVNTANLPPMFVYSRGFGGARFVEPKPAPIQTASITTSATSTTDDQSDAEKNLPFVETERRAELIYTGLPPVTVHEGEMLEAVLVNRLIVNTEPSPVITHLSRDLFDAGGRYVVFPANSRVIGYSQAINYKGSSRLFISFHRVILPNGLSIDLPHSQQMMKALDETGALGIVSHVNRHWMMQFGAAIFLGVIDGIAGYAQRNQADASHGIVISRTSENFDRVLDRVMAQYSSIVPTIRVDQGKTLRIYIADDMVVTPYARISDRSYYGIR
jgi:type IV secretory pathway VirB10-like protein